MKSRRPNRSTNKTSTDSSRKHRPRSDRDGTSKSRPSASDSERSGENQSEKSSTENDSFVSNPYHRPDKFAEDYQDRHRKATIWNQGHEKFLFGKLGTPDNASSESGSKKLADGEKSNSDRASSKRGKRPPESGRNSHKTIGKPTQEKSFTGAKGRYGEPITLAEEIALTGDIPGKELAPDSSDSSGLLEELDQMTTDELIDLARKENLSIGENENRANVIVTFLRQRVRQSGFMFGEGTLEILPDSYGFLRCATNRYLSGPDDIYISPSQIRRFGLRDGLMIAGQIRPPKERERYFALLRIEAINGATPQSLRGVIPFEEMKTITPHLPLYFRNNDDAGDEAFPALLGSYLEVDIAESPGSELVMNSWVETIQTHQPDCRIFLLSFGETKEGSTNEHPSSFHIKEGESILVKTDEPPNIRIHIFQLFLEKAKRMVEFGHHVIFLIHSTSHLIDAWNNIGQEKGDSPEELEKRIATRLKRLAGWARQTEQGGSLTMLGVRD